MPIPFLWKLFKRLLPTIIVVGLFRFELKTPSLSEKCSNQLSYKPMKILQGLKLLSINRSLFIYPIIGNKIPKGLKNFIKHPNDFRSHICRNPDGLIAPSAHDQVPYLFSTHLCFNPFYETIL